MYLLLIIVKHVKIKTNSTYLKIKFDLAISGPLMSYFTQLVVDDFIKVDLRIAKIIEANHVEGSDKLIRLKLDLCHDNVKATYCLFSKKWLIIYIMVYILM